MNVLFKRMAASLSACALACTMVPAAAVAQAADSSQELLTVKAADETPATDTQATEGEGEGGTETPGTDDPTTPDEPATPEEPTVTNTEKTWVASGKDPVVSASVAYRLKAKSSGKWTAKKTSPKKSSVSGAASGLTVFKPAVTTTTTYVRQVTTTYSDGTTKTALKKSKTKTKSKVKKYTPKVQIQLADGTWKTAGWNSGKTAKVFSGSNSVQAIKISSAKLKAAGYNVYYRVYSKPFGWQGWTKNGKAAGTKGQDLSISKVQVKLVAKGKKKPSGSDLAAYISKPSVKYALDMSSGGYTGTKKNGAVAGTQSWNAKAQRLTATVTSPSIDGGIEYRVRTGTSNWSDWTADGDDAGKNGKTAQAIKVRLTGDLADYYDVYYSTYCSDHHWLGWAKNGQAAGTGKINYPLGAVRIAIVPKGSSKPGSTARHYVTKSAGSGGQLTMLRKAQQYSSARDYLILVNRNATKVAVFKGKKNNWDLVLYSDCCVGAPGTPTPTGQFTTSGSKLPSFGEEKGYSVYKATNIFAGYFFHSILYNAGTMTVQAGNMNEWCSHGCIRMPYENAKWIYDHVYGGTKVVIY